MWREPRRTGVGRCPQDLPTPSSFHFVEGNNVINTPSADAHHKREVRRQRHLRAAELYRASLTDGNLALRSSPETNLRIPEANRDSAVQSHQRHSPNANLVYQGHARHGEIRALHKVGSGLKEDECSARQPLLVPKTHDMRELVHGQTSQALNLVGLGGIDPFYAYPFKAGPGTRGIIEHC